MIRVLVIGGYGQVGLALQSIVKDFQGFDFIFLSSAACDVRNLDQCKAVFQMYQPAYCINLAAYTAVDLAEEQQEKALEVNATGALHLSFACQAVGACFIHLSTDFVFDGYKETPYLPKDRPNPLNVYGASKLQGERYIQEQLAKYYIVRTSWVYSDFGHNFKKTMLKLAKEKTKISVVNDQIGCPTDAVALSYFLVDLIQKNPAYGIYHYCGDEVHSWFSFAKKIFKEQGVLMEVLPISSEAYPTKAIRPKYSVLEKSKF